MARPVTFSKSSTLAVLLVAHTLVAGCANCGGENSRDAGPPDGIQPAFDWTAVSCDGGTRQVETACVANEFDQVLFPTAAARAQIDRGADGGLYLRGTLLVSLSDSSTTLEGARAVFTRFGGQVVGAIPFAGFYQVQFGDAPTDEALTAKEALLLAADAGVTSAMRDLVLSTGALDAEPRAKTDLEKLDPDSRWGDYGVVGPPDRLLGASGRWAYQQLGVTRAWDDIHDQNPVLRKVVIGVLDSRVRESGFPGVAFAGSHDLRVYQVSDYEHGTAVSAIIGAPDNDAGMTGIVAGLPKCLSYDIAAMAVTEKLDAAFLADGGPPVTHSDGGVLTSAEIGALYIDAIFYGVVYAVKAGARVVNISMGQDKGSGEWRYALTRNFRLVVNRAPGTLFVISAGNDSLDAAQTWPCAASRSDEDTVSPNVMCIGATNPKDERDIWYDPRDGGPVAGSNYDQSNPTVTLSAPGEDILSQRPDGELTMFSGTSGAAPLVSGVAGLLFAILPGIDGETARMILTRSADSISDPTISGKRVNAAAAVALALAGVKKLHPETLGQGDCRPKTETTPSDGGLTGRIYLGATPYGQTDAMNNGLYVVFAGDGKFQLITPQPVQGVSISSDGRWLAAGFLQATGFDPHARVIDTTDPSYATGKNIFTLLPSDNGPQQLTDPVWLPQGNKLLLSRVGDLRLYDVGTERGSAIIWTGWRAAVLPSFAAIVETSTGLRGLVDVRKGAYQSYDPFDAGLFTPPEDPASIFDVAGSAADWDKPKWANGHLLILKASRKDAVYIVQLSVDGKSVSSERLLQGPGGDISAAAESPDGRYVAVAISASAASGGGIWAVPSGGGAAVPVIRTDLQNIWRVDLAWGP